VTLQRINLPSLVCHTTRSDAIEVFNFLHEVTKLLTVQSSFHYVN